jgi:hypothetical protein
MSEMGMFQYPDLRLPQRTKKSRFMSLRLLLCKALTLLRIHRWDCEHCSVYWRCSGEQMRKRLEDLRPKEMQHSG